MLQIVAHWPWWLKTIIAVLCFVPTGPLLLFLNKRYGVTGEAFMFAWFLGIVLSFFWMVHTSSTMETRNLFTPLLPLLLVALAGFMIGGIGNVFVAQGTQQAPNAGQTAALFALGSPVLYVVMWSLSKVLPDSFPTQSFSWVNIGGILLMCAGLGLVVYRG